MNERERGPRLVAEGPEHSRTRSTSYPTPSRTRLVESPTDLAALGLFVLAVVVPTIAWAWLIILVVTS